MIECKRLIANRMEPYKAATWYEKPLHGTWHKDMSVVAYMASTFLWLNKSEIRADTKALVMAAQTLALNTRSVTHKIYHTAQDPRCRLCKQHEETVAHIISCYSKLAETVYTGRPNNVVSIQSQRC